MQSYILYLIVQVVLCQCQVDSCGPASLSAKRKVVAIVI